MKKEENLAMKSEHQHQHLDHRPTRPTNPFEPLNLPLPLPRKVISFGDIANIDSSSSSSDNVNISRSNSSSLLLRSNLDLRRSGSADDLAFDSYSHSLYDAFPEEDYLKSRQSSSSSSSSSGMVRVSSSNTIYGHHSSDNSNGNSRGEPPLAALKRPGGVGSTFGKSPSFSFLETTEAKSYGSHDNNSSSSNHSNSPMSVSTNSGFLKTPLHAVSRDADAAIYGEDNDDSLLQADNFNFNPAHVPASTNYNSSSFSSSSSSSSSINPSPYIFTSTTSATTSTATASHTLASTHIPASSSSSSSNSFPLSHSNTPPRSLTPPRTPTRLGLADRKVRTKSPRDDDVFTRWRSEGDFTLLGKEIDKLTLSTEDEEVKKNNEIFPLCYATKNILQIENVSVHMYIAVLSAALTLTWAICGLHYLVKYYPICFKSVGVSGVEVSNDKHIWCVGLATIISLGPLVTFNYYTYFFLCSFFFVYWFFLLYSPSLISDNVLKSELYVWSHISHWGYIIPMSLLVGFQLSVWLTRFTRRCRLSVRDNDIGREGGGEGRGGSGARNKKNQNIMIKNSNNSNKKQQDIRFSVNFIASNKSEEVSSSAYRSKRGDVFDIDIDNDSGYSFEPTMNVIRRQVDGSSIIGREMDDDCS